MTTGRFVIIYVKANYKLFAGSDNRIRTFKPAKDLPVYKPRKDKSINSVNENSTDIF
jgi:hypothetical protein